jgi:isopenicillin N synthase-like dioxygenase
VISRKGTIFNLKSPLRTLATILRSLKDPTSAFKESDAPLSTRHGGLLLKGVYYFQKVSATGFRVLVQLLALSLGLDNHCLDPHFTEPMAALRLLHYANEESKVTEGIFACGAHSDYGFDNLASD